MLKFNVYVYPTVLASALDVNGQLLCLYLHLCHPREQTLRQITPQLVIGIPLRKDISF